MMTSSRNTSIPPSWQRYLVLGLKRLFIHPLKVFLILAGASFLFFSMTAHAEMAEPSVSPVTVSLSTPALSLQPGSELPIRISVQIPPYPASPIPISFDVVHPPEIGIDGSLQGIATQFSLARELRVRAASDAPEGDYSVILTVTSWVNGQSFISSNTLRVHVGPKARITYFTSPNTTLAPRISHVAFSRSLISMKRNDSASFDVSFLHNGSSTDYLIRFSENPIGLSAHIANAEHRFVDDGQSVSSTIELKTTPTTEFTSFPLFLEAYDLVSGEKTPLGSVMVEVVPITNLEVSTPFLSYSVEQNRVLASYLTLTNTEYGDQDVVIQSSSNLLIPSEQQVRVPSKSSVSIPLQIFSGASLGSRVETLYVMNASLTKQITLSISTIPPSSVPVASPVDQNSLIDALPSGLVTGVFSPLVGVAVLLLAVLLIFSKGFRDAIRARLPKPSPPKTKVPNIYDPSTRMEEVPLPEKKADPVPSAEPTSKKE